VAAAERPVSAGAAAAANSKRGVSARRAVVSVVARAVVAFSLVLTLCLFTVAVVGPVPSPQAPAAGRSTAAGEVRVEAAQVVHPCTQVAAARRAWLVKRLPGVVGLAPQARAGKFAYGYRDTHHPTVIQALHI